MTEPGVITEPEPIPEPEPVPPVTDRFARLRELSASGRSTILGDLAALALSASEAAARAEASAHLNYEYLLAVKAFLDTVNEWGHGVEEKLTAAAGLFEQASTAIAGINATLGQASGIIAAQTSAIQALQARVAALEAAP